MPQNPIPVSVYGPSYGTPSIQTSIAYDLTSLTWAANVVTAVTADPLPDTLAVGDLFSVTIIGEDPVGYNGQFFATVTGPSGFTYPLGSDPGSENSPGTFTILTSIIKDFSRRIGYGIGGGRRKCRQFDVQQLHNTRHSYRC